MIEIEGPPISNFIDGYGDKYVYITYASASPSPGPLVNMLANHMREIELQYPYGVLVWRSRPEIKFEKANVDTGPSQDRWALRYRFTVVPHCHSGFKMSIKPEFEEIKSIEGTSQWLKL